MNKIVKDTLAITVITLVAGLALGVVQDITADPIAEQKLLAKQKACEAVFEDAESFGEVALGDVEAELQEHLKENGYTAQTIDDVMGALDEDGQEIGYVFTVTSSEEMCIRDRCRKKAVPVPILSLLGTRIIRRCRESAGGARGPVQWSKIPGKQRISYLCKIKKSALCLRRHLITTNLKN